ncbi:MAG: MarR family [Candidatus Parcubacteria bacterium]|jgi:DNA-binding MarR family transcriptional regulator
MTTKVVSKKTKQEPNSCLLLSTVSGELMHKMHRFHEDVTKRVETLVVKNANLTFSQYIVLISFLSPCRDSFSQKDLAEHLNIKEATVSRHIKTLEQKKLLKKEKLRNNKKTHIITISPLGKEIFTQAEKVILQEIKRSLSPLKDKEQKQLLALLTKLS